VSETSVRHFHYSQKTKVRSLLISGASLLFMGIVLCIPFTMLGFMIAALLQADLLPIAGLVIGLTVFIMLVLAFPVTVSVISLIALFKTYLDVSPEGVVYDHWGQFRLAASWGQIEKIDTYGPFNEIVMYPRDAEIVEPFFYQWRRGFFKNPYPIPLKSFEGWPDGELAALIRQYAPHLIQESV
jgi:hypothetical protein